MPLGKHIGGPVQAQRAWDAGSGQIVPLPYHHTDGGARSDHSSNETGPALDALTKAGYHNGIESQEHGPRPEVHRSHAGGDEAAGSVAWQQSTRGNHDRSSQLA